MDPNPDLTRILQILAATAATQQAPPQAHQQAPPQQQQSYQFYQQQQQQPPFLSQNNYGALQIPQIPQDPRLLHTPTPPTPATRDLTPIAQPAVPQHQPPPAESIDPRNITEWSVALKYVMKTLSRDEAIMAKIQRMKKHQHEHERIWWNGREDILKKHVERVESTKKMEELLRNLGTFNPQQSSLPTPENDLEELRIYDQKVHLRSEEMVKSMSHELSQLGVPFFCGGPVERENGNGTETLAELRRRMLELLEDLSEE
ncbi:hypothetical protein RUND412_000259 [Rhizina undulata]